LRRLSAALESAAKNPERVEVLRQLQLQDRLTTLARWCSTNQQPALLEYAKALNSFGRATKNVPQATPATNPPVREVFKRVPDHEPVRFSAGQPLLTLPERTTFACDGAQVWLRDGYLPAVYEIATGVLTDLEWPPGVEHYITCIVAGPDQVWFGTAGSGLL